MKQETIMDGYGGTVIGGTGGGHISNQPQEIMSAEEGQDDTDKAIRATACGYNFNNAKDNVSALGGIEGGNISTKAETSMAGLLKHNLELKKKLSNSPPSSLLAGAPSIDKTDNRDTLLLNAIEVAPREDLNMHYEENRLKSFENWPIPFLSPEVLARNGFYYLGRGDEVRCAFCKVEIMRWLEGDDPAKDHKRWAPQCPFLRNLQTAGNVPLSPSAEVGRDECGVKVPREIKPLPMPGPVHPRYATEAARLASFKEWPRSLPQKPEDLAEAGFFYTGVGDKTKCFYCDGGLKDWENDDVPWEQHARWFDRCAFVQLVKGREYVQKVMSEACAITTHKKEVAEPAPEPKINEENEKEEKPIEDTKLCKICYAEERNICFVPCGHVVACAKCALTTNKCPMCRRTFQNAVRLYYS